MILSGVEYIRGYCGGMVSLVLKISGAVGGEMSSGDETISFTSHQQSMVVGKFRIFFNETQIYNNGKMIGFQSTVQEINVSYVLLSKEHNATIR